MADKQEAETDLGIAPRINLIAQNGESIDSETFSTPLVVGFFFSSCSSICPALLGSIRRELQEFENRQNKGTTPILNVLLITVDPQNDTPQALAQYAEKHGISHAQTKNVRWHFLTGDEAKIRELLINGFYVEASSDKELHSTRLFLLDRQKRIKGSYQGLDPEALALLKNDIRGLLD